MADDKLFITRLKTPDGQIHYLKDIEAHEILEGLAAVAMSGDYEDLLNKPIVDAEVSGSSTNAIQNKAIKTYVDNLIESLGTVLRYKGMKDTVEEIKTHSNESAWIIGQTTRKNGAAPATT